MTNTVTSLNDKNTNPSAILSTSGNVVPNWDPLRRAGGTDTSLGYDKTFTGFVGRNGNTSVTSYYPNAFTGSEFGSWDIGDEFMITVSGQTYPSSGAKVTAPTAGAEQVPDRRAFSINMELPFTVVDDDPEPPVVQGFNIANYTDAQMTNASGFAISGQIMDDYSGVEPTSISFSLTNANPTPVFDNVAFSTRPGSSAATKGVFAALSHTVPQVPYADNQTGTWAMVVHGTDVDNDRTGDAASTNRIFNFTVTDDDTNAPTTVLMNFPGALMNVPFIVITTNGTAPGDKIRGYLERRSGTVATNVLTSVSDGDLAQSGTTNLQFVFGAQDTYSGPSRGTSGDTNSVMSFNIGNIVQGNFANYNAASSTALSTNALTNYWTFADGYFDSTTINSMMAAGNMQVLVRIPDADNDRPSDRSVVQTQVGMMRVLDDDIRGPTISSVDIEGGLDHSNVLFTTFEASDGWPSGISSAPHEYTWTQTNGSGRTWVAYGAIRSIGQTFSGSQRMGLMGDRISWFQLPPLDSPRTLSFMGSRAGSTGAVNDVTVTIQYSNAGAWTDIQSKVITNRYDDVGHEMYTFDLNLDTVVTLRMYRANTPSQVYFDDLNVVPMPEWVNTNQLNVEWTAAIDDFSGLSEYRYVAPIRGGTAPTATNAGVQVAAALTNVVVNLSADKEQQGLLEGFLAPIDGDADRNADRAMGSIRSVAARVDRTPPTKIPLVKAVNDMVDDPSSQFDISWNENDVVIGGDDITHPNYPNWNKARKGPNSQQFLSPWKTYKIYYGPYDPMTEGGNIYGDFVSSGTYKTWNSVSSTNTIEDPGAAGFQPDYSALTNSARKSIRLYDLDYDKDYIVVVVGVDEAGNESTVDNLSWSTNNTIKFAVTQGLMKARSAIAAAFPTNNNLEPNDKGAAALY